VPIAIHPASLVQVLQFWLPRTVEFEEAIVASIKYPIFFYEYSAESERVTIRILEALSRFEGVGDLPKETVARVLLDEGLRRRLVAEKDIEQQVGVVKEVLVAETAAVRSELAAAQAKSEELSRDIGQKSERIAELERLLEERRREESEVAGKLRAEREELTRRIGVLEETAKQSVLRRQIASERLRFLAARAFGGLVVGVVLGLLLTVGLAHLGQRLAVGRWSYWSTAVAVWAGLLMVWLWWLERNGAAIPAIREWAVFSRVQRFRRRLFATLWAVLLGALGNAFYDWIRRAP
jgi:hypothetical protein